jgi:sarcosine oxidase
VGTYDAIVIGLGAVGSATAYQLAKRGARVLGIDRFSPPHDRGSSHGGTRITRLAIGEGEHYTPLAIRAHEIWREIEHETGADLLCTNGGLIISSADTTAVTHVEGFFENTVAAARRFGIAHDLLDAHEIRRRYPMFAVADEEFGYFEPGAGFVRPESCVHAQLRLAEKYGADLHMRETVRGFDCAAADVVVTTDRGRYQAEHVIVAAGAWLPELIGREHPFKVFRQVQYWFSPKDGVASFRPDRFPVFIWELRTQRQGIYGFPATDGVTGGIKIATEYFESATDPKSVAREVSREEIAAMHETFVVPHFPCVTSSCVRTATCLYTVTPDFGFVIDRHPDSDRMILASPCSGHGFKHSPAIGEALAQIVVDGASRQNLDAFRLSRFAG